MSIKVNQSGTLVVAKTVYVRLSTGWAVPRYIWVNVPGTGWKVVFYQPMVVTATPPGASIRLSTGGTFNSRNVVISVTGGSGNFTYLWTLTNQSSGSTIAISSATASTVYFSASDTIDQNCTATCVVTDTVTGAKASVAIAVFAGTSG